MKACSDAMVEAGWWKLAGLRFGGILDERRGADSRWMEYQGADWEEEEERIEADEGRKSWYDSRQ